MNVKDNVYDPEIKTNLCDGKIEGVISMEKIIVATFKVRGTEKEIEKVRARIASLTACEEIISMYFVKEKENEEKFVSTPEYDAEMLRDEHIIEKVRREWEDKK